MIWSLMGGKGQCLVVSKYTVIFLL